MSAGAGSAASTSSAGSLSGRSRWSRWRLRSRASAVRPGSRDGNGEATLVAQVRQLLDGIPQSGATLGNPKAPVTMTLLQRPAVPGLRRVHALKRLPGTGGQRREGGQGEDRVPRRRDGNPRPAGVPGPADCRARSGEAEHFWDYVELFYRQQGTEGTSYVTEKYLNGLAQQVPQLNLDTWRSARNDSSLIGELQSDQQSASTARVQGTPTLIFQGPRGTAQTPQTVPSYEQLQQAIKSVS